VFKHCFNVVVWVLITCFPATAVSANLNNTPNETLQDPTAPLGYQRKVSAQKSLVLQAVYLSASRSEAIINGQAVREGSVVDGATVIKVRDKSVVYSRNGQTGVISLRPNIVKHSR